MSEKIPKGWKWVKLGEVAEIKMGQSPESKYYNDKGIGLPFLQGNKTFGYKYPEIDIFCSNPIKIAKKGEVLISVRAPVGDINIANQDICIGRGLASINSLFNQNEFLFYCLKYSKNDLLASETGTVFGSINKDTLNNFSIPLPPLPEQKAIAEVLSSLDDKIDLLHRQNKTLEEMAMTLFRQWFIEPTKDGLPEGWEEVSLGEFIKEILGGDWGKEKPEGEYKIKVNCIRGTDISDLQDSLPKKTPIRFIKQSKFKSIEPKDGDIILEISGGTETQSTGRSIYISSFNRQLFEYPIIFSNFCRLLRPKENYYTYYLYLYLKYLYINDEFFSLENGTSGIKNLDYKTLLYDLKYPMPKNTEIYLSFYENVSILFEKIDKNKFQIQTLEKLRDTLLPKLMSGEVRVKV